MYQENGTGNGRDVKAGGDHGSDGHTRAAEDDKESSGGSTAETGARTGTGPIKNKEEILQITMLPKLVFDVRA